MTLNNVIKNEMKYYILSLFTILSMDVFAQNLSADLQREIASLGDGETLTMEYVKRGCWGTYEGGGVNFKLSGEIVEVELNNQQAYSGASSTSTKSSYDVDELIQTLEENKKSFSMDDSKIVLANSFDYRIIKDGEKIASGSSSLEPADVIHKVALSNSLRDSFLGKKKELFKNSGLYKGPGIKG